MASTYKWADLLTYVMQSNPRLQADAFGALLCDQVNSAVWAKYDWRIALKQLPPFYLVPLVQDYVTPYLTMPTDFLGLRQGVLVYNGSEPPMVYPPLTVDRYLDLTTIQGRPEAINYQSTTGGLRIYPRPSSGIGVMDYQVECVYKANPTKVTSANLSTTMPFDDQYFSVYAEGLKYYAKPAAQQSDQDLARFSAMVASMASHEAENLGQQPLSPREPLVNW